jgi:hypothetical protein
MFPVEPRRGRERDEELRAVCVGPRVGHAEDAGTGVPQGRIDLVLELVAVDGGAAAAGARGVAALDHEVRDDAVEDCGGEVAAAGEGGEVVAGFGGVGCVELEGDCALLCLIGRSAYILVSSFFFSFGFWNWVLGLPLRFLE